MPNKNYIAGRRKEYQVMNQEKKAGNIVLRSAGSHSCIDVVSIDVESRVIKLIQCKPNDISKTTKDKLETEMKALNNTFKCMYVLM
jgi:Holliday junction resolvase